MTAPALHLLRAEDLDGLPLPPEPEAETSDHALAPRPARRSWRSWDARMGVPGPVHGPRRDLPGGAKEIPWAGVAPGQLGDLVYFPAGSPPQPGSQVVLTEGEKAADAAAAAGAIAVGTVCGASNVPGPAVIELLARYRVILSPDNDEVGVEHMTRIAGLLEQAGVPELRWIDPTGDRGPSGEDLADLGPEERRSRIAGARELPLLALVEADTHSVEGPTPADTNCLRFVTAREFAAMTPALIEWVWERYLAVGALIEVVGRAKASGKSTLLAHLARAVLDGLPFLGQPTRRGPVVWLTEQPPASLRPLLDRAGLGDRDDLHLLIWRDTRGVPWYAIAEEAVRYATSVGAVLLIVDTLPAFAGIRGDAENDAGAALEAIRPLQVAAADGLAVIVVRHERKGGGDVGESARGSSAFTGAVDVVLRLSRRSDGDRRPNIRELAALSRFDETPELIVIELTDHGYELVGTSADLAAIEARDRILEEVDEEGLTRRDLEGRGLAWATTAPVLDELIRAGSIVRVGAGKRGDPYRFQRPSGEARFVSGGLKEGRPTETKSGASPAPAGDTSDAPPARASSWCDDMPAHAFDHRNVQGPEPWCAMCSPERVQ